MARTIKSKIALATGFLFSLLLVLSVAAFVFVHQLSSRTESLLAANYQTIRYCNEMMHVMDKDTIRAADFKRFDWALMAQEANITEAGEGQATQKLRFYFDLFRKGNKGAGIRDTINAQLYRISVINQRALERKNDRALKTAEMAKIWIAFLSVLVVLTGFTLSLNFPGYIADPVRLLTEAIHEISQKNYHKRIHLNSRDEFGQMARAFNAMAQQLDQYENSNMAKILFEKKRAETIINQMEDAVIGTDAAGKILFINTAAEDIFHLKAGEVTGKYAPDIALYNDLLRTVLQKDSGRPLKIISNGKEHFFSVDARAVSKDGESLGEVFTLSDITSFKELDISKTNLLATISHELKTPISSIKMSARLLNDARVGSLNPEQQELMYSINSDTERLLRLTGELLNMTQLETGNIQLKIARTSAVAIATAAIAAVQMQLQEKQITIHRYFPEGPAEVMADADKTEWVIINFLTNAIKYSPQGSSVDLRIRADDAGVCFAVKDNGEGISEAIKASIFDRYFKDPLIHGSNGLGLSIAKEFIEAQKGSIRVESTAGTGSTFYFTLPKAAASL